MTIKERIEKLLMSFEGEPAPIALAEYTTTDGAVIKCAGELAEGVAVTVMGEGGEVPAPDGVYELDNGKVITVANGMISKMGEKEGEPTTEYALKADFDAAQLAFNEKLANFEQLVTKLSAQIETLTGGQKDTLKLMQEFAAIEPAPEKKPANIAPDAKEQRLAGIKESLNKLNK